MQSRGVAKQIKQLQLLDVSKQIYASAEPVAFDYRCRYPELRIGNELPSLFDFEIQREHKP